MSLLVAVAVHDLSTGTGLEITAVVEVALDGSDQYQVDDTPHFLRGTDTDAGSHTAVEATLGMLGM